MFEKKIQKDRHKVRRILQIILFVICSGLISLSLMGEYNNSSRLIKKNTNNKNKVFYPYLRHQDTIYVLGDTYIEVCIKKQYAYLYQRNDPVFKFRISSGTSRIKEGLDTPPGLFTVQNKTPLAISKQFNNAELFNWIGFRGNIGFHGLKGSGYYYHLGFRPSSHGCIRISREDGEMLYKKVKVGTPVLVYENEPAITLSFAQSDDIDYTEDEIINRNDKYFKELMTYRINNLYSGSAYRLNQGRIFIDGQIALRLGGLPIGEKAKISRIQKLPVNISDNSILIDKLKKVVNLNTQDTLITKTRTNTK